MTTQQPPPPPETWPPLPPRPPQAAESLRLTYEYEGGSVRLVSQQRLDVAVTNFGMSHSLNAGHVVDVLDAEGTTMARIPVDTDLGATTEVFGLPGEPIVRGRKENPRGAFSVIVPAPVGAAPCRVAAAGSPDATCRSRHRPGAAPCSYRCGFQGRACRRRDPGVNDRVHI